MNRMPFPRILAVAALAMQAAAPQFAADVVNLTLTDAVHMAISQNRALRIARLKVAEMGHRKAEEHAHFRWLPGPRAQDRQCQRRGRGPG